MARRGFRQSVETVLVSYIMHRSIGKCKSRTNVIKRGGGILIFSRRIRVSLPVSDAGLIEILQAINLRKPPIERVLNASKSRCKRPENTPPRGDSRRRKKTCFGEKVLQYNRNDRLRPRGAFDLRWGRLGGGGNGQRERCRRRISGRNTGEKTSPVFRLRQSNVTHLALLITRFYISKARSRFALYRYTPFSSVVSTDRNACQIIFVPVGFARSMNFAWHNPNAKHSPYR